MIAVLKLRSTELTGSKVIKLTVITGVINKYTLELNVKNPKYCTHDVHKLIVYLGLCSKDHEW